MKESAKSYRTSHIGDTAVTNYSDIYSGFHKNGRIADRFSYARWLLEQQELNAFLDKFDRQWSKRTLLDFACGTGRLTKFLEERFGSTTGVDISQDMLDRARERCSRAELICTDLTQDNILSGRKFDIITAFRFFLRCEDPLRNAVFARIYDLLAKDGLFIFNVHDSQKSLNWPLYLFSRLTGKESPIPGAFDLGHRPHYGDTDVRVALESAGFCVEKVTFLGLTPNWLYGLPFFFHFYLMIDRWLYSRQWFKRLSIERIYYCRKRKNGA